MSTRCAPARRTPRRRGANSVDEAARRGLGAERDNYWAAVRVLRAAWVKLVTVVVATRNRRDDAPEAYERFDNREEGYSKVVLHPQVA